MPALSKPSPRPRRATPGTFWAGTPCAWTALLLAVGCAHAPFNPATYRSPEGYQAAHWGQTPRELEAELAGAERPSSTDYVVHGLWSGRPATITWSFPSGHLASVVVQREGPEAATGDFDGEFEGLVRRFGSPRPAPEAQDNTDDEILTAVAIVGVILVVGILIAIAAKGGGGGGAVAAGSRAGAHAATAIGAAVPAGVIRPAHEVLWVDFAALRVGADALQLAPLAVPTPEDASPEPPAGGWMAEWRTRDSQILLLGVDLGAPDGRLIEAYRSLALISTLNPR